MDPVSLYIVAPLVKIKQAIQRLKQEVQQMDIRTGVVEHILIQAKLKERTSQKAAPNDDMDDTAFVL